jgi:hypothetical protein
MLVQRQVGHPRLELAVLLLRLTKPPQLGDPYTGELAFPSVKCLLAHAELATDLCDGGSHLHLAQGIRDLLLGKS